MGQSDPPDINPRLFEQTLIYEKRAKSVFFSWENESIEMWLLFNFMND